MRSKVKTQDEKGENPSRGEKIKEIVLLLLLNIILPSVDVYSDIGLILKFYVKRRRSNSDCDYIYRQLEEQLNCYDNLTTLQPYSCDQMYRRLEELQYNFCYTTIHYNWGTLMLLPFLLNYLICWYVWATTDKRKTVTWIAALLSFYPQYVACKIIYQIWWVDPKRGLKKKRHLERDVIQLEVFYESVPSMLVMTYLLVRASYIGTEGRELIFNVGNLGSFDSVLFLVGFSSSIITSSLGLAKNLKVGPCRILPEQKRYLGGLLSPRFVLIFFACGFTLLGKGVALANAVAHDGRCWTVAGGAAIALSTFFLPGFLVGLFSCLHLGILKTFLAQPSVFLLPVFTHFTSRVGGGGEQGERFISFSPISAAVNVGVSVAGILTYIFTMSQITGCDSRYWELFYTNEFYLVYGGLPCSILGLILTLVATFSNQCNCCKASCGCSEPFEFAALVTSSLHTPYIVGPDGQLVREGENEEEEVVELEMEESKDSSDHIPTSPSTPNTVNDRMSVMSETEVEMEADKVNSKEVHVLERQK